MVVESASKYSAQAHSNQIAEHPLSAKADTIAVASSEPKNVDPDSVVSSATKTTNNGENQADLSNAVILLSPTRKSSAKKPNPDQKESDDENASPFTPKMCLRSGKIKVSIEL